jgi:thioester reductase-like protein
MKKALLFGATGFIGSYLLTDLLNDPNYTQRDIQ